MTTIISGGTLDENLNEIKSSLERHYLSGNEKGNSDNSELKKAYKKVWIYRKICAVVDFSFNGVNFAFNVYPLSNGFVSVDVLQRKSKSDFLVNYWPHSKLSILQSVSLDTALEVIDLKCKEILIRIEAHAFQGNKKKGDSYNYEGEKTKKFKKKRVGILTLPQNKNYGGNLQAYALTEVLSTLGHESIFINRRFSVAQHHKKSVLKKDSLYSTTVGLDKKLPNSDFLDRYLHSITKKLTNTSEMAQAASLLDLDAVVVGSDQVWRPKYADSLIFEFFLNFLESNSEILKISYAASFGADKWEFDQDQEIVAANLIKKFDAISVREDIAVDMCQQYFATTPQHVLDPTMLLSANHYITKFSLHDRRNIDDFLLCYVLDLNKDKIAVVKNLSNKLDVKVCSTNGDPFSFVGALDSSSGDRSVEGWLASFFKSSFVITDSFHGAVFSIIFNKPFIAYANPNRGMARFTSLLKLFGLENRLVKNSSEIDLDKVLEPIDWDAINRRLEILKKESISFLTSSLSSEKQNLTNRGLNNSDMDEENIDSSKIPVHIFEDDNVSVKKRKFYSANINKKFTIADVLERDMCIGCGACSVITVGKVSIEVNSVGLQVANENDVKLLNQEDFDKADSVCPFSDSSLNEDELDSPCENSTKMPHDPLVGRYAALVSGRQLDKEHLMGSSSGGLTSWLIKKLFEYNKIDAVIHVGKSQDINDLFEYRISSTMREVDENRKSNYYPATLKDVLDTVKKSSNRRFAIVGVPCFIKAARSLAVKDLELKNSLHYFLGLVCGHMKSRSFAEANSWQLGVSPRNISSVDFRKKLPNKKVNQYDFEVSPKNEDKSYSAQTTSILGGNWGHAFFQPNACNYCDDIFAETSDAVFGDAWLPKYKDEWIGTNIAVLRNYEIVRIFEAGVKSHEIFIENLSLKEIKQTQSGGFGHRREGLKIRLQCDRLEGLPYPAKRIEASFKKVPFWRIELIKQRKRMSELSLVTFSKAKENNDLSYFKNLMSSEIAVYKYIETLKDKLPNYFLDE